MKYFERDGKYNFVDSANTFVGYDSGQDCCEDANWKLFRREPDDIFKDNTVPVEEADGYKFSKTFFKEIYSPGLDSGGAVLFKLQRPGCHSLYLCIYNAHNGYYGHGFEVKHGGITVKTGNL